MAEFDRFLCLNCGYSIETENRFYYRTRLCYHLTMRCSKCKVKVSFIFLLCQGMSRTLKVLNIIFTG